MAMSILTQASFIASGFGSLIGASISAYSVYRIAKMERKIEKVSHEVANHDTRFDYQDGYLKVLTGGMGLLAKKAGIR